MAESPSIYSISGKTSGATASAAKTDTPEAALRRLRFDGPAGKPLADLVDLDPTGLRPVARQIDDERVAIERAHNFATAGAKALTLIEEKLRELADTAAANGKAGVGRDARRANQAKVDTLVKEIGEAARAVGTDTENVFGGGVVLEAGDRSLAVEELSLDTLGRISANGRVLSLGDLQNRGPLDTTRRKSSVRDAARRSIEEATEQVGALKEKLTGFDKDSVLPRIGDVATAMEGLYENTVGGLPGTDEALAVARQLRTLMLSSATSAAAAGADGWDRERVLALLT